MFFTGFLEPNKLELFSYKSIFRTSVSTPSG